MTPLSAAALEDVAGREAEPWSVCPNRADDGAYGCESERGVLLAVAERDSLVAMARHGVLRCDDCGLKYIDFPLDMTLPDEQWLRIHPEGMAGVLCAQCIVTRARTAGAAAVRAVLDI